MYIDAFSDTIIAHSIYKLSKETPRAMLACLQHTILVWAVAYTGCGVFSSPWCSTDSSNTRKRQAGREGDVALGLTNDLDTGVWISFTSIAASKCTSLSLRIHMATMELERIQKQPTGRLFLISTYSLTPSLTHSFTQNKWERGKIGRETSMFIIPENLSAQWVKCFAISRIWL